MYSVIQFNETDGGTVSIINNSWFTPRRCEVFWPPVKGTKAFEKLLVDAVTPDEKWKCYGVKRVFCETDDIDKAKKKLKLVEDTSDLQTDAETEPTLKRKRPKRYVSSSNEDDKHIRPPPLKKNTNKLHTFQAAATGDNRQSLPNISDETVSITQNLAEDDEEQLTSFAQQYSPRAGYDSEDCVQKRTPVAHLPSAQVQREQLDRDERATPSRAQGLIGYQAKVLSLLSYIQNQNDQIISLLKNTSGLKGTLKAEFKFPIKNDEDELNKMESLLKEKDNYDNLVSYIRSLGGKDISCKVSRVMKFCFTDQLAEKFNFYGKRSNKKPFCQLRLRDCVVEGVVSTTSGATAKEVEDAIKNWLKHAPERLKKNKN